MAGNKTIGYESKVHDWRLDIRAHSTRIEAEQIYIKLEDQTFGHGLATGICLGMRIIGVCFSAVL